MKLLLLQYFLLAFLVFSSCQNGSTSKVYSISEAIIDKSNFLKKEDKSSLFFVINRIESRYGSRVAILIADTLYEKNINEYAFEYIENMQLRSKKDALLIVLAPREKISRIEVAYGLERIINDELAARIIKGHMTPHFKKKKYYEGLLGALIEIERNIESKKDLIGKRLNDNY